MLAPTTTTTSTTTTTITTTTTTTTTTTSRWVSCAVGKVREVVAVLVLSG